MNPTGVRNWIMCYLNFSYSPTMQRTSLLLDNYFFKYITIDLIRLIWFGGRSQLGLDSSILLIDITTKVSKSKSFKFRFNDVT